MAPCAAQVRDAGHSLMLCNATAGAGGGWRVRVRHAGSVLWSASPPSVTFSYPAPQVQSIETMSAASVQEFGQLGAQSDGRRPTDGSDRIVRLQGSGFGYPGLAEQLMDVASPSQSTLLGRPGASLCVYFAWTGRPSSPATLADAAMCDGLETFWGEGELAAARVVAWTDSLILLEQPSGLGHRDIVVSVFGQLSTEARALELLAGGGSQQALSDALSMRWRYDPPLVRDLSAGGLAFLDPREVPTDGSAVVALGGAANLGPSPRDTLANPIDAFSGFPMPITDAENLPTAGLLLNITRMSAGEPQGSVCITGLQGLQGERPLRWTGCAASPYQVQTRDHSELTFRMVPGVGADLRVQVLVADRSGEVLWAQPFEEALLLAYESPSVEDTSPRPVLLDDDVIPEEPEEAFADTSGLLVEFGGDLQPTLPGQSAIPNAAMPTKRLLLTVENAGMPPARGSTRRLQFGTPGAADVSSFAWTPELQHTNVSIGQYACVEPSRIEIDGTTQIECGLPNVPVGRHVLTARVAGQWISMDARHPRALQVACGNGFHGPPGSKCLPCPDGATCRGFDADVSESDFPGLQSADPEVVNSSRSSLEAARYPQPQAIDGHHVLNSTDQVRLACPDSNRIPGRDDLCVVACEPPFACLANNLCAVGYASRSPTWRCASCADGYYRRAGGECAECPDNPWLLVAAFIIAIVLLAGVAATLQSKKINIAYVAVGVDHVQALALFASARISWPPILSDVFNFFSAFNLNLSITSPECLASGLQYRDKWFFIQTAPIGLLLLLSLFFGM